MSIHCRRYEWVWLNKPAAATHRRMSRDDIGRLNGHGQLTGLIDRDHVAGDPAPNAAVPVARYAVLLQMPQFIVVRSGWSANDGSITFTYLDPTVPYMIVAPGFTSPTSAHFDAVCTDSHADGTLLYPELMP